jgi:hypothetical protein
LGYKPNTPVSAGIEKFIKWYKQYFFQLWTRNFTLWNKSAI